MDAVSRVLRPGAAHIGTVDEAPRVRNLAPREAHANGTDDRRDGFSLELTERWRPEVVNQHDAKFVTVVPRLMFDRVVKYEGLTLAPVPHRGAAAETAARWNNQSQVADESCVGDARVRRNMRP